VKAVVQSFVWGESVLGLKQRPFDVIILSDVVTKSYAEHYDKLLQSVWDLAHDETKVCFCGLSLFFFCNFVCTDSVDC
jgi:hypothetical protein